MFGYFERIGTRASDILFAQQGDIVYAGPGDDEIFLGSGTHAYLIGGSGDDTYLLGNASYAVILDSSGHDTIAVSFDLGAASTFIVTIDGGRHFLLGDLDTDTLVLIEDNQNRPIEAFNFNGFITALPDLTAIVRNNGMHLGDVTYRDLTGWGFGDENFWSVGMQAEIDALLARENALFPPPQPGVPGVSIAALVDANWYFVQNPDVAAAGLDAATHYAQWGWHEGRNPNRLFDTQWYLADNPDVAAAAINPLEHYLDWGFLEGREIAAVA